MAESEKKSNLTWEPVAGEPALVGRLEWLVRGNAPPHVPANLEAVQRQSSLPATQQPQSSDHSKCADPGVGTSAFTTQGYLQSEPRPMLLHQPSSLLLLVQPREAQRCEWLWGNRISNTSPAGTEMKLHSHNRPLRSACCSPRPSAGGARAKTQTDPKPCRSDSAPTQDGITSHDRR